MHSKDLFKDSIKFYLILKNLLILTIQKLINLEDLNCEILNCEMVNFNNVKLS